MPPAMPPTDPNLQRLAERVCEAAADQAGILDQPVLMSPSSRFSAAKHVAAGALRALGYTHQRIATLLGYSEVPPAVDAAKKADPSDVAAVVAEVTARGLR